MRSLLRRKKPQTEEVATLQPQAQAPASQQDNRFMLLIPDGAFTHHLVALPDAATAGAYVDAHLVPGQSFLSFKALDPYNSAGRPGEALVVVRDENRPEVVRPYSFTDVKSAHEFIEAEFGTERVDGRLLFFWAEPFAITPGSGAPAPAQEAPQPQPAPVASHPSGTTAPVTTRANMFAKTKHAVATAGAVESVPLPAGQPGILSRMAGWPGWDGLAPVMVDASLCRRKAYYDAMDEDDYGSGRAAVIVVLGALSAAAGALGGAVSAPTLHFTGALLGWALAAAVMYRIALIAAPGKRPENSLRRFLVAMGFAYSPAFLLCLGLVPIFGPLLVLGVLIWLGATLVAAAMTALEAETEAALIIAFGGWMALFGLTLLMPELIV